MAGMTAIEKILAEHSGRARVQPGDAVEVDVDTIVVLDINFMTTIFPAEEILKVDAPEKIVVIFDHFVPANTIFAAEAQARGRAFVQKFGISRFHDIGQAQGISHQVVADEAYIRPGELLVCADSHTCSGGAFNAAAHGLGSIDMLQATCLGKSWFICGPTVRYRLDGETPASVTPKDVFLQIANEYGMHGGQNMEFCGSALSNWTPNERRALSTMCAEVGVEFPVFPFDDVLAAHYKERSIGGLRPVVPDRDAQYAADRVIDVSAVEPMVALPGSVVHNCRKVTDLTEDRIAVQQCFVGSCSNGTLEDIRVAADIVRGRHVSPGVRFIVTPSSEAIHRQAVKAGYVSTLQEAGAVVTSSACGACGGVDMGVLGQGELAIASSTRNYKGRMGSPDAGIFLASSATVAATAVNGYISDPRGALS